MSTAKAPGCPINEPNPAPKGSIAEPASARAYELRKAQPLNDFDRFTFAVGNSPELLWTELAKDGVSVGDDYGKAS